MECSFLEVQEIFEFVEGLALPTQSSQLNLWCQVNALFYGENLYLYRMSVDDVISYDKCHTNKAMSPNILQWSSFHIRPFALY
jgi:hypothetical protein